jgi:DNA-directed RNA polymerase subunit K/omega
MSVRSRLVAEAEKQISNPFVLCTLVSQRTRQLMMRANTIMSTAQLVDFAFNELIAGVLKFDCGKPRYPAFIRAGSRVEESRGGLESPAVTVISAALLYVEAT